MTSRHRSTAPLPSLALLTGAAVTGLPARLGACSGCVGTSDSALASGMNLGVLTLAACTVLMLGLVGAAILRVARLARAAAAAPAVSRPEAR